MPKINVYLPDGLAEAVREANLPVSAICQSALERAVRDVASVRGLDETPTDARPALGLFARFTPRARQAITLAEEAARAVPHNYVGTEHLLIGVIDEGTNLGVKVLDALDVEPADVRREVMASMGRATRPAKGQPPFTPLAKAALEATAKEALSLGHNYIGCEHLLLGLLTVEEGLASQVLRRMGLELRTTKRTVVTTLLGFVHAQQTAHAQGSPEDTALDEIRRRLDAIEARLPS